LLKAPGERWILVAGLGVTTIVSYGVTQYLFGVLVVPIQHDLGWSRAQISGAFSLGLIVWGVLGVPVGRLVDHSGARWPMTAGSLLAAFSLLGLARIHELWQLYLLWSGGLGTAMALTLYPVTFTVVANWFQQRRGAALALLTVIGGLSSPLYVPLAGWLVAHLGWRDALEVLAATVLLIALPLHALLVRQAPVGAGPATGSALGEALRRPPFWLLTASNALSALAYAVLLVHTVPFLIGRGYNPVLAAGVFGLIGVASLPGRFLFNLLSDRVGPQGLLALCTALQGAAVAILLTGNPVLFVLVYGATFGAISPLRASTMADHFGRMAYGSITAVQNLPSGILSGLGPFLAGYLYDRLGGYNLAFELTAGAFLASSVLIYLTPRSDQQERQPESLQDQ